MSNLLKPLPLADVEWVNNRLRSRQFGDIYFAADGVAESHQVIFEPAKVIKRAQVSELFTVFEFGFGTGLNFLALAQSLYKAGNQTRVRYLSVEQYPLQEEEIRRALGNLSGDLSLSEDLIQALPPRVAGWHRRYFPQAGVELSLYYGDVADGLGDFASTDRQGVDAWFLDGFAPERNPYMWREELFKTMRELSKLNGTVTTFSAAGHVRRGLEASGFAVTRVNSEQRTKRHTTLATVIGDSYKPERQVRSVQVIGGGIAGTSIAHTLARKGVAVDLIEQNPKVGMATSAIPFAIQHPRLSAAATDQALLRIHAYAHAHSLIENFQSVEKTGAIQLVDDGMSGTRLEQVCNLLGNLWCRMLKPDEAGDHTNGLICAPGAFYPLSSVVNTSALCEELCQEDSIKIETAVQFEMGGNSNTPTVLATGVNAPKYFNELPMEITVVDGQVDVFKPIDGASQTKHILIQNGYVAPTKNLIAAGSTYEYKTWEPGLATTTNMERVKRVLGDIDLETVDIFRSSRVITSDRFAIAGQLRQGCWASWGHASGGTISAPYSAELIASQILGEVPIGTPGTRRITSPDRFELRQRRRPNPFEA